jgi:N-acetylmuramoyl-L-alanine amidase
LHFSFKFYTPFIRNDTAGYNSVKSIQKKSWAAVFLLSIFVFSLFASFLYSSQAFADTSRRKYFNAEACYNDLKQSKKRIKYRHNWLKCINKFQSVYKSNPSDPWAPAGLYMSGKLYHELYKYSRKTSDKKEAVDIFERVVSRYPRSKYKKKSSDALKVLTGSTYKRVSKKPSSSKRISAKRQYQLANKCYLRLENSKTKQKYRDNWMKCIHQFQTVYKKSPYDPWAPAGLYMTGKMYHELYKYSHTNSDKNKAIELFEYLVNRYPRSKYRQKATADLKRLPRDPKPTRIVKKTNNAYKQSTSEKNGQTPSTTSHVMGIRVWSNPNYTRVAVDLDNETTYAYRLLKKDSSINKPQRLYVDFNNSKLGKNINRVIPIDDDLLTDARAGQFTKDKVRVVVDIKSFKDYKVFSLNDPFRLVIDLWGEGSEIAKTTRPAPKSSIPDKNISATDLAKQLALGVQKIVIDPGHGGRDFGAPGYIKGVHEKDITLAIAKKLTEKIKKELPCEVVLTRDSDKYLTLEERTAIANTKNGDLFISIHTNASRSRSAYGIETYFLNFATDDDAVLVAARENATSKKNISDLESILTNLMQNSKINESSRLAGYIQKSMVGHLKSKGYGRIKNKGVKQAPFYVLIGAQMPAVLIETSFISNSRECKRLTLPQYQTRISEGIVNGIFKYIKELNPTALVEPKKDISNEG